MVDIFGIFEFKCCFDCVMVVVVWGGVEGFDIIVLVVDVKGGIGGKVMMIVELLVGCFELIWLIFNKVDFVDKIKLLIYVEKLNVLLFFVEIFFISVGIGDGLEYFKDMLVKVMFVGLWYFFED